MFQIVTYVDEEVSGQSLNQFNKIEITCSLTLWLRCQEIYFPTGDQKT